MNLFNDPNRPDWFTDRDITEHHGWDGFWTYTAKFVVVVAGFIFIAWLAT